MKVTVGNLMAIPGTVRFTDANTEVDSVVIIVIASVTVILLLLSAVIFLVCVITRNHCNFNIFKRKLDVNTNVNMYASPAYGTHQVFAEPGLDHTYETINETRIELQSVPPKESSDDKAQDRCLTIAGDRDQDQETINVKPISDQGDTPFNNSNNSDDDSHSEYENDDLDNIDYLQLQHEGSGPATDHSCTTNL